MLSVFVNVEERCYRGNEMRQNGKKYREKGEGKETDRDTDRDRQRELGGSGLSNVRRLRSWTVMRQVTCRRTFRRQRLNMDKAW